MLRKILNEVLVSDSDFDAFCLDRFDAVYRRLTGTMDRVAKTTMLLNHGTPEDILSRLREDYPEYFARFEHLLKNAT